jgi:hypothetical protein
MPDRLAVAQIADRLVVLDHVGNDVDFRKFLEEGPAIRIGRRRVERAEILAEGEEVRIREPLLMRHDDEPAAPGVRDGIDLGSRQRSRQIDAA